MAVVTIMSMSDMFNNALPPIEHRSTLSWAAVDGVNKPISDSSVIR
jgi:hypothetical protein